MDIRPLALMPEAARRKIDFVLADIDDTVSTDGRVTAAAFTALERLRTAGKRVIPITGRPAGWCDHIARMWPVDAVVGENGAFYMYHDERKRKLVRHFAETELARAANRTKLDEVALLILSAVPGCALASDQRYREADLAIDYCEDVPRLARADVERIVTLMRARGMTAKVSSIHVNGWFGAHDKLTMTRALCSQVFGTDLDAARECFLFVGDSPNDAPMFEFFPHSVGVANIRAFLDRIGTPPVYITRGDAGAGFVELADCLLDRAG